MRLFHVEKPRKRKVYIIKGRLVLFALLLFLIFSVVLFLYNTSFNPVIKEKARVKANYVAVHAINTAVQNKIRDEQITYEDFTEITRKEDGTVSSISINSLALNTFKSGLTDSILKQVSDYGYETVEMRPFAFLGYIFAKIVPRVPIVIVPSQILAADVISSFKGQGINQTKHEINLVVEIDIKLLLPIGSDTFRVKTTVPLVQTIIVGSVPDTYTNVEGVTESESDTILNLAP